MIKYNYPIQKYTLYFPVSCQVLTLPIGGNFLLDKSRGFCGSASGTSPGRGGAEGPGSIHYYLSIGKQDHTCF